MKLGSLSIADVKLGSSSVQKIYQGTNLVWQPTATGYRYIRWTITKIKDSSEAAIQAMEFRVRKSGSVVSWNAGVTATDLDVQRREASQHLVDGDISTKWRTESWGTVHYGQVVIDNIVPIDFDAHDYVTGSDATGRDPIGWTLEGSNDNSTWTLLDTVIDATITDSRSTATQSFALPPSGTGAAYRYIRWDITDVRDGGAEAHTSASELRLRNGSGVIAWNSSVTIAEGPYGNMYAPPENLIDGDSTTQWFTDSRNNVGSAYVIIDNVTSIAPTAYDYATNPDVASRDPITWRLLGSSDGVNWRILDKITNATITGSRSTYTQIFTLP